MSRSPTASGGGDRAAPELEVSVVIPTHNRRDLLETTLESALWQRGVSFEIVVVDDGSTDDTSAFLRSVEDPRIRVVRNEAPRGVSRARNRGIEESHGHWIAFLDDDDLWAPDKLRAQLDAATASGARWVYAGVVKVDSDLTIVGGAPPPSPEWVVARLKRWNPVPGGCSAVVVHRDALPGDDLFDPQLPILQDWDLWTRVGASGPPAVAEAPLVAYRLHPSNRSLDLVQIRADLARVQGRLGTELDWGSIHYYLARLAQRSGHRSVAATEYLKAATRGEGAAVARELVWLVWRRLGGGPKTDGPGAWSRAWSSQARSWLDELSS
jgi:glycosyltransferase involved in cell wall biosynthesis